MLKHFSKNKERKNRVRRVRAKVSGTTERPRLSVFRSLKNVSVQVIDDAKGITIVSGRTSDVKGAKNTIEGAFSLGKSIGEKCVAKKITTVVFDRSGYRYHGKVKAIADGARAAGLIF